ncbi:hypothetical protein VQ042_19040 [Aurantimonas sp. A2-1-M11]|uniref:hypothetical protein n=1 Tax=Aurantimonas sp. A2-1-M11 TaxID=3113712 RepID=UPI002F9426C2
MHWNSGIRQFHRWLSIIFALVVAAIFGALAAGWEPAEWAYFVPLPPLALLLVSGLYPFALPYLRKSRAGHTLATPE